MKIYSKYKHHGEEEVYVRDDLKGKHGDFCLCQVCHKFKPGKKENCVIAQATFENCILHNVVTPMWECPQFDLMNANSV